VKTVVVGGGAGGLWCALHAAERGPVILVATDPRNSATAMAQGGIAAAVSREDDAEEHASDTIEAGAGLCDPAAVDVLTGEGPTAVREVVRWGMRFDAGGAPALEGGHTVRRVLHAGGDETGRVLLETLLGAVRGERGIELVEGRLAALLVDGRTRGVRTEEGREVEADRVVLATGGACGIFGRRTGPHRATGEAMALAWRAGAPLADLEFVQFHPTALDAPGHPARLLTEALRGEGAVLIDADGRPFMGEFHARADLGPRDVVARAVAAMRSGTSRPVYLDATRIEGVAQRFPTATRTSREAGLDIARDPIPVAPAAHYFIGGILTDTLGRTAVPGLLACGEVACTGVHGANRLASNSLLEALVFGARAAVADEGTGAVVEVSEPLDPGSPSGGSPTLAEVRKVADRCLGVSRSEEGLRSAVDRLGTGLGYPAAIVARLVAAAALRREESRGAHFREDHPDSRDEWRVRQAVTPDGWASVPVPTPIP
jgi:L-aspartate oxidase